MLRYQSTAHSKTASFTVGSRLTRVTENTRSQLLSPLCRTAYCRPHRWLTIEFVCLFVRPSTLFVAIFVSVYLTVYILFAAQQCGCSCSYSETRRNGWAFGPSTWFCFFKLLSSSAHLSYLTHNVSTLFSCSSFRNSRFTGFVEASLFSGPRVMKSNVAPSGHHMRLTR